MGLFEWSVEENPFYEAAILTFKRAKYEKKLDTDLHRLYIS